MGLRPTKSPTSSWRLSSGISLAGSWAPAFLLMAALGVAGSIGVLNAASGRESGNEPPDPLQDGVRAATPPVDAAPLPPIQDPRGIDRRDLTDGVGAKGLLEGTWQLTAAQRGGLSDPGIAGVLIATRSHLVVHLQFAEGTDVGVQSSWRRYRIEEGVLITEVLAGHGKLKGEFRHERPSTIEQRYLRLDGTRLRIEQDEGNFMEFVRVE